MPDLIKLQGNTLNIISRYNPIIDSLLTVYTTKTSSYVKKISLLW